MAPFTQVLLLVLISNFNGTVFGEIRQKRFNPCIQTLSFPKKRPAVRPGNSSHVLVSWGNVFQGDCEKGLKTVHIVINNQENFIEFDQKKVLVPGNLCFRTSVFIRLIFNNNNKVLSQTGYINLIKMYPIYIGLLKETVSQWICLKEEGTVTILDPPEAFAACVISRGDVKSDKFMSKGQSGYINIELVNPTPGKDKWVTGTNVKEIKKCSGHTTGVSQPFLTPVTSVETTTNANLTKNKTFPKSKEPIEILRQNMIIGIVSAAITI